MDSKEQTSPIVNIKNSVALHLLKVVFSLYLGVTVTLTVTHMSIEYFEQKREIVNEFIGIQESFEMPLSNSLWEYFDSQLESILVGMNKLPNILGVRILDGENAMIVSLGVMYNEVGEPIIVKKNKSTIKYEKDISLKTHKFPLTYVKNETLEVIGQAVIFYDSNLAYERVKLGFILIIINSALKTIALWGIFLFFSRKILTHPLSMLAEETGKIQLENLNGTEKISLKTSGRNELKILEESFNKMIHKLFLSKKELADINLHLEKKVHNRTDALAQAMLKLKGKHDELEVKHKELMLTQSQLVQSEKMVSLGTLVAGIAHEINNPTNFVYVNSRHLQEYLKNFQDFLLDIAGGADADKVIVEAFDKKFEEMFELIQDINEGSDRIKTLVIDLRKFSRLEEAECKNASIEKGIMTTIRLIESQYKRSVRFNCIYGNVPNIECWPAQLNQVFMNIIINACQAIIAKGTSSYSEGIGEVKLETFHDNKWVGIRIQDNGIGFTEENKKKIFDPFFTTKKVGEGVGLGLSITYGIIKKHKGRVEVNSTLGVGTTFTIYLPKI